MYQPVHFQEERPDVLHALIRAHPLGLLISGAGDDVQVNPLPFLLDDDRGEHGILRLHMARANEQWKAIAAAENVPVLAVFQGVNTYVTPSWYESKREHGRVVPTWNYAIVEVRGRARVIEDTDWLTRQISDLTAEHEGRRNAPWAVTDAPSKFIDAQLRAIVGLEIEITRIDGKWKVSQNRPENDRKGVADGLALDKGNAEMASLVRRFGGLDS